MTLSCTPSTMRPNSNAASVVPDCVIDRADRWWLIRGEHRAIARGLVHCTQPLERQLEFDILGSPSAQVEIEGLLLRCPAGEAARSTATDVPMPRGLRRGPALQVLRPSAVRMAAPLNGRAPPRRLSSSGRANETDRDDVPTRGSRRTRLADVRPTRLRTARAGVWGAHAAP